jgi:lipid-A-disaccharide synthase
MKYFLIAGEPSGDVIGAKLMASLMQLDPEAEFSGIGGPLMLNNGLKSVFPMNELTVMGIWEVLIRLPQLLKIINGVVKEIEAYNPDAVLTIDFPDFNFQVAKRLKKSGKSKAKIIHYVAPTVWAWRPGRAIKIAKFLDALLCLFPFEPPFFTNHKLRAQYVGHPVTQDEYEQGDRERFRAENGIPETATVVGAFFGSREEEIEKMGSVIRESLQFLIETRPDIHLIVPTLPQVEFDVLKIVEELKIPVYVSTDYRKKQDAMSACDVAIAVSGTVGLELAYIGTPHVIVYKTGWINYLAVRMLVKVKFAHLANIIMNKFIVPEFLQGKCNPEKISKKLIELLDDEDQRSVMIANFQEMRDTLVVKDKNGNPELPSDRAARYILGLIRKKDTPKPQT